MAAGIYKPEQGYWTRMMTALGFGLLVVVGGVKVADYCEQYFAASDTTRYSAGAAFVAVLGVVLLWLVGRQRRVVDFLIATEGEMHKVNWSTRKEVLGSTWVVVAVSIVIAAILLTADIIFMSFFRQIGLLEV